MKYDSKNGHTKTDIEFQKIVLPQFEIGGEIIFPNYHFLTMAAIVGFIPIPDRSLYFASLEISFRESEEANTLQTLFQMK